MTKDAMKEEHGNNKHGPMLWLGAVQVLLLFILVVQIGSLSKSIEKGEGIVVQQGDSGQLPDAAAPSPAPTPSVPLDMKTLLDDDSVKGAKDAPVTIVEWSDFECPFCGKFYKDTLGQIDEKYIKTGKVKLVYRDFPLSFHPQAQKAAEAAECAGEEGKYWEMHDMLFEKGVQGGVESFKGFAKELGLKTDKFNDCLDSGKMAAEVRADMNAGSTAGIRGTPGFIVNGQLVSGAQPFEAFEQVIEAALKQ